jgi:hypothetical protein
MSTKINTQDINNSAISAEKLGVLNTKGDLLSFGTMHDRLPVGSDNQVLIANSNQPNGLSWASIPRLLYTNSSIPLGNTITVPVETAFQSSYTIPANALVVGNLIRIKMWGTYTLGNANFTLKLKFGSTTVLSGTLSPSNITNLGWNMEASCVVMAIGALGSIDVQGNARFATSGTNELVSNMANLLPFTVNTTQSIPITSTFTFSKASSVTLRQFIVELLS